MNAKKVVRLQAALRWPTKCGITVLVGAIVFASCCVAGKSDKIMTNSNRNNIVAGPGEKTFAENYALKISLPISEREFLSLVGRLGLHHEHYGERNTAMIIPTPRHSKFDLANIEKCYKIYGRVDRANHVGMDYRAYVDQNHRVVYIENDFSYPAP